MIEMRWLLRRVPQDQLPGWEENAVYAAPVLQFRVDISASQGVWFHNKDDRYSQWQDVPVVKE